MDRGELVGRTDCFILLALCCVDVIFVADSTAISVLELWQLWLGTIVFLDNNTYLLAL